jgi:hypothetical protein
MKVSKDDLSTIVRGLISNIPAYHIPGFGQLPPKKQEQVLKAAKKVKDNLSY